MATNPISGRTIASTADDAALLLSELARQDGDDFRVRILRRTSAGSPPESIAVIDGVTIEQLFAPEQWLSMLSGGSAHYTFQVMHAKDKVGGVYSAIYPLPAIGGDPLPVNAKIVEHPDWPRNLKIAFAPGARERMDREARANGKAGGSLTPHAEVTPATNGDAGGAALFMMQQLQRERENIAQERHRAELDAVKRESAMMIKGMEDRLNAIATRPAQTLDLEKVIASIAVLAAPIIGVISEGRKISAEAERERQAREADREEKRQARESAMLEKIATQSSESAKVIGVFTESLSTVARSMVQTVAMVGELRGEPQVDNSIMGVIKAAVGAWAEAQARAAAQPPPAVQQQQIAASHPPVRSAPPPTKPASTPTDDASEEVEITAAQMLDLLAKEISERADPNEIAASIVEALGDADFAAEIQSAGGLIAALRPRVGEQWANDPANVAYIQRLFQIIGARAQAAGMNVAEVLRPPAAA